MADLSKPLAVAVGVLMNADQAVFIATRSEGKSMAGYWEFPGGKLEQSETPPEALCRELQEELGITVLEKDCEPLCEVTTAQERPCHLSVYLIKIFQGIPRAMEGQADLRWVAISDLPQYQFPDANQAIIRRLFLI